jgi:hypothetical protein
VDNPVRAVESYVCALDLSKLWFRYADRGMEWAAALRTSRSFEALPLRLHQPDQVVASTACQATVLQSTVNDRIRFRTEYPRKLINKVIPRRGQVCCRGFRSGSILCGFPAQLGGFVDFHGTDAPSGGFHSMGKNSRSKCSGTDRGVITLLSGEC